LMLSPDDIHVVTKIERIDVEESRSAGVATASKITGNRYIEKVWKGNGHVNSQRMRVGSIRRRRPAVGPTRKRSVKRVQHSGAEAVCISKRDRVRAFQISDLGGGEDVLAVKNRWVAV